MSNYFLGQIMLAGFNFAPRGFATCNGQLMPLQQNQALYSLLGVRFGGDGRTTFALPDMRSRTPVGSGPSADGSWQPPAYVVGAAAGAEIVTLLQGEMPMHTHPLNTTTTAGTVKSPANALYGGSGAENFYAPPGHPTPLIGSTVGMAGGNQPHPNLQPYSALGFNIAMTGIFPSRS
ncbi:phage tail protein [Luteibacter sp. 9135]|uniref:phage tail protein n=1 Tax=Luteibacter sp. 9135 TaxID=1500893 RepID=UPI0005602DBD|nr:tail fiber protein [Luteibacter sp. 9135]